ncbi:GCG_CRPN prefix-to-repeats domain-containing protein [Methylobacterium sp. CM6247]
MKHVKTYGLLAAVIGGLTMSAATTTTAEAAGGCGYGYYPSAFGCKATSRAFGYYAPRPVPVYGYGYGYRPYYRPYAYAPRPYAYAPRPYVRFGF